MYKLSSRVCLAAVMATVSFFCLTPFAGEKDKQVSGENKTEKKLDAYLGSWVSDNDVRLLLFFDDNTYLSVTHINVHDGYWKLLNKNNIQITKSSNGYESVLQLKGDILSEDKPDYVSYYRRILKAGRFHALPYREDSVMSQHSILTTNQSSPNAENESGPDKSTP